MVKTDQFRAQFLREIDRAYLGDELFDAVPDTVFFLKDREGRYTAVNTTLVERCGLKSKAEILGRKASEVFPKALGERFAAQDRRVIAERIAIHGALELHLYPDGSQGWCLTWKEPVIGRGGRTIGLAGISRDVMTLPKGMAGAGGISKVLDYVEHHIGEPLPLPDLARIAGLSVYQIDQRIRALFGISAGQYITRARIERACNRLTRTGMAISAVALDCGYGDQAAFTRQFRKSVGLTPRAYRKAARA